MDRAEGALLVAEKALEAVRALADVLEALKSKVDGHDEVFATIDSIVRSAVDALHLKDGADGLSAYEVAKQHGFVGSALDWLREIKGADGKDGRDGRDGRDGIDGKHGIDAAHINPLPAIDKARTYPQGTWAKHLGGLWLARSATDGMAGWDCIVEGLTDFTFTIDDDREVGFSVVLSSGKTYSASHTFPVVVYRDVFKEGTAYRAGDAVTWAGSMFIAKQDTSEKPGTGDSWRLAVKRGRDGKDGSPGRDGERGPEGRAGKDFTPRY